MPRTMLDKIWDAHEVAPGLMYIDLHLIHELSSPQAFGGLRASGRTVRRPDRTLATADHSVPTDGVRSANLIVDALSRRQVVTLEENCDEFGIPLYSLGSGRQGIVHVIGPELGITQPGMTIVCGDSHTATHGAFGALGFGIGTSQAEHVFATQTLPMKKPKSLRVVFTGEMGHGVTPKDLIMATIGQVGTSGFVGHAVEYTGPVIERLGMAGRMTICNMTIEGGGRSGMIAPDETTFAWLRGRPGAPADFDAAVEVWRALRTDEGAVFDAEVHVDVSAISPMVTWGTTPGMVIGVADRVPDPASFASESDRAAGRRTLEYMGLQPGASLTDLPLDHVFIGSCTNARIEDLREAARIVDGHRVADGVRVSVVPGSEQVKADAEQEGLDRIFLDAGFEWHHSGCSMCGALLEDAQLSPGQRCASTSNRNFEGRQGPKARTHLVSPAMAAAAAIAGHLVDIRDWSPENATADRR
ncbi:3-isopropylmalate dehydratase large subunit [Pseudonocardia broussonetiae]|uniref:3-isopropylmalate dehydratase large subunit n=1 Tax=Pseudonocardia broussonetiae TaxID=2736640 RepID=A0A6M6JL73_9PSEU|nr:3-isopropylmalate dehydratase large subunit [Pseudonocardia broussonetiae]QJY48884.1 3-isopropylmalate dehydratase large subunit [Pseudonocardia broussonetiae]